MRIFIDRDAFDLNGVVQLDNEDIADRITQIRIVDDADRSKSYLEIDRICMDSRGSIRLDHNEEPVVETMRFGLEGVTFVLSGNTTPKGS